MQTNTSAHAFDLTQADAAWLQTLSKGFGQLFKLGLVYLGMFVTLFIAGMAAAVAGPSGGLGVGLLTLVFILVLIVMAIYYFFSGLNNATTTNQVNPQLQGRFPTQRLGGVFLMLNPVLSVLTSALIMIGGGTGLVALAFVGLLISLGNMLLTLTGFVFLAIYAVQLSNALKRRWLNLGCMLVPGLIVLLLIWSALTLAPVITGAGAALPTDAQSAEAMVKQMAFDTAGLTALGGVIVLLVWGLCLGFHKALKQTAEGASLSANTYTNPEPAAAGINPNLMQTANPDSAPVPDTKSSSLFGAAPDPQTPPEQEAA